MVIDDVSVQMTSKKAWTHYMYLRINVGSSGSKKDWRFGGNIAVLENALPKMHVMSRGHVAYKRWE